MKLLIQRVKHASVSVEGKVVAQIPHGMLALVAIEKGDTVDTAGTWAKKLAEFRIFEDEKGKMNLSIRDIKGEILVVPEFTLAASTKKGTRPGFDQAEQPERAKELMADLVQFLTTFGMTVRQGIFGARMEVLLLNDGPVTFLLGGD